LFSKREREELGNVITNANGLLMNLQMKELIVVVVYDDRITWVDAWYNLKIVAEAFCDCYDMNYINSHRTKKVDKRYCLI
jgi:hypothetical protein